MKKIAVSVLLTAVLLLSSVQIASAITDGHLDGDGHPLCWANGCQGCGW